MNNRIITEITAFAGGIVVGFFAAKTYFKTKYENEAALQVRTINERAEKSVAKIKKKYEQEKGEREAEQFEYEERRSKFGSLYKDGLEKMNYSTFSNGEERKKEDIRKMIEDLKMDSHPEEDIPSEPYTISIEEFMDDSIGYDKSSLTYFMGDRTLIDESEEIADVDMLVGREIYNSLALARANAVYLRNPKLSMDFEIILSEGNFEELITGGEDVEEV